MILLSTPPLENEPLYQGLGGRISVLAKPFTIAELKDRVRSAIDRPAGEERQVEKELQRGIG